MSNTRPDRIIRLKHLLCNNYPLLWEKNCTNDTYFSVLHILSQYTLRAIKSLLHEIPNTCRREKIAIYLFIYTSICVWNSVDEERRVIFFLFRWTYVTTRRSVNTQYNNTRWPHIMSHTYDVYYIVVCVCTHKLVSSPGTAIIDDVTL